MNCPRLRQGSVPEHLILFTFKEFFLNEIVLLRKDMIIFYKNFPSAIENSLKI